MKTQKTRYARFFALAVALAGLLAIVPAASAQYTSPDRDRDGYPDGYRGRRGLRGQSYERMRQYARQLDELAREANRQAQRSQAGYRSFRRDTKFLREIRDFAARASQFRARMETYQTRPWAVDDELAVLVRDARDVEERLRRARFVDRPTVADWNRAVGLLNQMTTEYQAGIGYRGRYPGAETRTDPYPDRDYRDDRVPGPNYGNYGSYTDLRQLARELDQRASRASQLATGYTGYSSDIRHFSEQANDFRDQVETNRMSRSELRSEVNRLLEDADAAYSELRQRNVSREIASEWSAIVQILNRMRDLAV
jgi:methyl-accepting chemotaxis protein